jgi:hypothetical protein
MRAGALSGMVTFLICRDSRRETNATTHKTSRFMVSGPGKSLRVSDRIALA